MSMSYQIRQYPDPILSYVTEPVIYFNCDLANETSKMLITMYANDGIGLAANQVGLRKRIIVMDVDWAEETAGHERGRDPKVLVNPVIKEKSSLTGDGTERCLSFPDVRLQVTRAYKVVVDYQDIKGNPHTETFTNLAAACIQHEIDHLNGITLANKMSRLGRRRLKKRLRKR